MSKFDSPVDEIPFWGSENNFYVSSTSDIDIQPMLVTEELPTKESISMSLSATNSSALSALSTIHAVSSSTGPSLFTLPSLTNTQITEAVAIREYFENAKGLVHEITRSIESLGELLSSDSSLSFNNGEDRLLVCTASELPLTNQKGIAIVEPSKRYRICRNEYLDEERSDRELPRDTEGSYSMPSNDRRGGNKLVAVRLREVTAPYSKMSSLAPAPASLLSASRAQG